MADCGIMSVTNVVVVAVIVIAVHGKLCFWWLISHTLPYLPNVIVVIVAVLCLSRLASLALQVRWALCALRENKVRPRTFENDFKPATLAAACSKFELAKTEKR